MITHMDLQVLLFLTPFAGWILIAVDIWTAGIDRGGCDATGAI